MTDAANLTTEPETLAATVGRERSRIVGQWTRVALMGPSGQLLWGNNPPGGTWVADHPCEALTWACEADALDWLYGQSDIAKRRLADGGWRLVELTIVGWSEISEPLRGQRVPIVAEASCEVVS